MKVCKVCNTEKEDVEMATYKIKDKEGFRKMCWSCHWQVYQKPKYKYGERDLNKARRWRENNPERLKEIQKRWVEDNPEKVKENRKKYQELIKSSPIRTLKEKIRHIIKSSFKRVDYKKNEKTENILGCKYQDFIKHIEKQFEDGMSWDNHGEWHLDHIIPISSAKTEEEVMKLNHYTNFQPLWAIDNLKKGKKLIIKNEILDSKSS